MSNPKVHICGHPNIYVPDDDCNECIQELNKFKEEVSQEFTTKLTKEQILAGDNVTIAYDADNNVVISSTGGDVDLSNYYTKTETYNKSEVDALIDAIETGEFVIVDALPTTGNPRNIYLVPKTGGGYTEYIYVEGEGWEEVGSTDIDLSNYYTKTQADALLADKVDKVSGKGLSTNDYTNADKTIVSGVTANLNNKVDKVAGKGLSTNDYTTAEKNKLAGIEANAEVNVQSDWNVTDSSSDAFIKNKPTIPDMSNYYNKTQVDAALANKQNKLTAGSNVQISGNTISATDTKYTAGTGLQLSGTQFSAKTGYTTSGNNRAVQTDANGNLYVVQKDSNTTYTAGEGLQLSGTEFSAKLGYTTSGNNRKVQADANGNLYVIQKDNNTTYTAGTGLVLSGTTINHSNSVTALTTAGLRKIAYDGQGHITSSSAVSKTDVLNILGYKETTISMTSTDGTVVTETILVKI